MILSKHTTRTNKILSKNFHIYAYGGLSVTIEVVNETSLKEEAFHIEFTESELRRMLKKIEDRKEEIDIQLKGPNE